MRQLQPPPQAARVAVALVALCTFGSPVSAQTIEARVVTAVGSMDGAGPDVFSQIEALELDPERGFYVLDGPSHELHAFGLDGRHRWSFGQEGEGPGEFRYPVGLTRWAGDVWVIDPETQRATVIDDSGDLIATHHLPAGVALSPWPGRFDRHGNLYSYVEASGSEYGIDIVRYGPALAREAILRPPDSPEPESYFEGRTRRGSHMRARVPFTPRVVWRIDSAGDFVWGWTADPVLFRAASGQARQEVARFTSEAHPVTAAERGRAIESLSRFSELGGRIEADRIPDTKPVFETFVLDELDRPWVLRGGAGINAPSVIQRLDPGGAELTVSLPVRLARFPTPVVRAGYLLGVERGEFGVERVVLVRLGG